ncbi:MAG TPA: hypothetical protein VFK06_03410 [Candidatus Angelobacter sp.]|nr:hypothetical protein [Candidatus Angelobacter sp.]
MTSASIHNFTDGPLKFFAGARGLAHAHICCGNTVQGVSSEKDPLTVYYLENKGDSAGKIEISLPTCVVNDICSALTGLQCVVVRGEIQIRNRDLLADFGAIGASICAIYLNPVLRVAVPHVRVLARIRKHGCISLGCRRIHRSGDVFKNMTAVSRIIGQNCAVLY